MAATARGQVTPIMDKLIFKGVRALLGGKVRMILAGGAPLSPESHDFLRTCMGCPLMQVSVEVITPTIVSHKTPLICTLSSTCSWIEGNF